MISNPRSKCKSNGCKENALWGIDRPLYCDQHYDPRIHTNLVEKECVSCNLVFKLNDRGLCEYCDPEKQKRARLYKQYLVTQHILNRYGSYVVSVDRVIDNGECIKERPDVLLDFGTHFVVIEVDEHQHKDRVCECEHARMVNIGQALGLRTMFIRYNPDPYKTKTKSVKDPTFHTRMKTLVEWVKHLSNPDKFHGFTSVVYLYYDGFGNDVCPATII